MNNQKAFTLIELLVVVLIIGILAAVAIPQYQKAVGRARYTQLKTMGEAIFHALQRGYLANGEWPTDFGSLDIEFSKIEMFHEGEAALFEKGQCRLRPWVPGSVQCETTWKNVPGFQIERGGKPYCFTTVDATIKKQICQMETGKKVPDSIEGNTYERYYY